MDFKQTKSVRTGINSALDLSPDNKLVASLSRADSKKSSKFTYTLEIYQFPSLEPFAKKEIYDTYSQGKHFVKFSLQKQNPKITVVTQYHIYIFSLTKQLPLHYKILHKQLDIYDFTLSNDGRYMVLVADKINIWRLNDYKQIVFPSIISAARFAQFSRDDNYLGICSNNQIYIYKYDQTLSFQQVTSKPIPAEKGDITSFDFSPNNANRIAIGYVNSNPDYFNVLTSEFQRPALGTQPSQKQNPKIVEILPDGKRILSSDFINGVGIWPGIGDKLFYKQKFLIYGIKSDNTGTKFTGFVWQSLKIIQIVVDCGSSNFLPSCPCGEKQIWNYSNYSCQNLVCSGLLFATGNFILKDEKSICQCVSGFFFNPVLKRCQIDCSKISNSLTLPTQDGNACRCNFLHKWNSTLNTCDFTCQASPFSTAKIINASGVLSCQCLQGFIWNSFLNTCQCPKYMRQNLGKCECLQKYTIDAETKMCKINCSLVINANSTANSNVTQQQCICNNDYEFIIFNSNPGCRINCNGIKNALPDAIGFDFCLCQQKTNWSFQTKTCQTQCLQIPFAVPIANDYTRCQCAVNYIWHPSINQCGKSCLKIPHLNSSQVSTIRRCPCINHFQWLEQKNRCEVDCASLNFTTPYPLPDHTKCECNNAFYWDKSDYKCLINCTQIWKADKRVSDGQCSCQDNLNFNKTLFNCQAQLAGGIFENWWMILILVLSALAFIIISAVLLRFCYRFASSQKQQNTQKANAESRKSKNIRKKLYDDANQKKLSQINQQILSERQQLAKKLSQDNLGVQTKSVNPTENQIKFIRDSNASV